MEDRPRSSLLLMLLSFFLIVIIMLSPIHSLVVAPVQAQINTNQPGQPYASVVNCIRPGAELGGATDASPRFITTCFSSAWYKTHYNDPIVSATWDAAYSDGAVYAFGDAKPDSFSPPEAGHVSLASIGNNGSSGGGTGVGAVYGLAYDSGRNPASPNYDPSLGPRSRIYAAAFAKRITRFGDGGPGAIYLLDRSNDTESVFVQVPNVMPGPAGAPGNPGDGSRASFPNGTNLGSYTPSMGGLHAQQHDDPMISWASRAGLGDIELDPQGRYLYGVNLWQRVVFRFDTWAANPQSSYTTYPWPPQFSSPAACNTSGSSGPQDIRPFALRVTDAAIYLGYVCSAENGQNRSDLGARVVRWQFANNAWDANPVLVIQLNAYDAQRYETATWNEPWQPWWNQTGYPSINTYTTPYAQPLLASIDFDEHRNMVIGLHDRLAEMSGGPNLGTQAGRSFGDLLLAPLNATGGWDAPSPAVPERYWDYNPALHNEMTMGAATYVPGTHAGAYGGEITTTFMTPYRVESAGAGWYDLAGGSPTAHEELYNMNDNPQRFGKANGLGDIELLCDWRAIGDRIWNDSNGNGSQDGGEADIQGVLLNLKNSGGAMLAQVTTGAVSGMSGNYRFYVDPYQSYTVEIDASNYAPGKPLYGLSPTSVNVGSDLTDSDAASNGQIAIASAGNGDVNTSFDAGLSTGANVKISKSGPASAAVGSSFAYGLLYSNAGPTTAQDVIITDTLPAGLTLVSASPAPTSISGQTLTWGLGAIAVGASANIAVTVQVDVNAPASVLNSSHISTSSSGDNPGDNDSSVTTQITRPNVWITKTGTPSVTVGQTIGYTLSYGNNGSAPANGVTVVDTLPAGTSFVSAIPAPNSVSGQTLTWNVGTLNAGATGSITVNATATVNAASLITNGATISTPTPGDSPADNSSSTNTNVLRPNVMITKAAPVTVTAGDTLSYSLSYSNTGNAAADGVNVADTLPAGVTFVSATPAPTSQSGQTLTWNLGTLSAGLSGSISVTVQTSANLANGASLVNSASISTPTPGDNPGDNSSIVTTTVQRADVYVTKSSSSSFPALSGTAVSYTIDYGNTGPATAKSVTISDPMPSQLSNVTWQCVSGCTASGSDSITNLVLGDLAAGATGRITVTGTASTNLTREDFSNTATISTVTPEIDTSNNQSTVPGAVWTSDLQIIKLASPQVIAGATFTTTLSYRNNGPAAAQNAVLNDTLPAGVTLISASPAVSSQSGQTLTWNLGTLSDQQNGLITLLLQADAGLADQSLLTNHAELPPPTSDRDSRNNSADASTLVLARADVQLVKTGPVSIYAGEDLDFTITVTNNGPSLARGLMVTDTLPSELDFIAAVPAPSYNSNGILSWTIGDLTSGQSVILILHMRSRSTQITASLDAVNQADVTSSTTDPDPDNNRDDHTIVIQTVDLQIDKSMPALIVAGLPFTATLSYHNAGPASARNVVIRDFMPAGLSLVSASPTPDSSRMLWNLGSLAPGASGQISLRLQAATDAISGTLYVNTATIDTSDPDRDGSNNTDQARSIVRPHADLSIVKDGTAGPIESGSQVSYSLRYHNAGPSRASNVTISDTLPAGFTLLSAEPAATQSSGALSWQIGDLDVGASGLITLTGTLSGADQITTNTVNTAVISSSSDDPDLSNNADDHPIVVHKADLSIRKSDAVTQAQPGDLLTYSILVRNQGLATAHTIVVTEFPPAGSAVIDGDGWEAQSDGSYQHGLTDLAAGASASLRIRVRLPAPLKASTIANRVEVDQRESDPTPEDNEDTDIDTLLHARVGDTVWRDDDGNGRMDAGEPGLPDVTVVLSDAQSQTQIATTRSDAQGHYLFEGLRPGRYLLRVAAEVTQIGAYRGYRMTTESVQTSVLDTTSLEDLDRDFGMRPQPSTDVTLTMLKATADQHGTTVRWQTVSEIDTARFLVLWSATSERSTAIEIASVAAKGSQGGDYAVHYSARSGFFWLIEVERNSTQTLLGVCWPQESQISTPFDVFLPAIIGGQS